LHIKIKPSNTFIVQESVFELKQLLIKHTRMKAKLYTLIIFLAITLASFAQEKNHPQKVDIKTIDIRGNSRNYKTVMRDNLRQKKTIVRKKTILEQRKSVRKPEIRKEVIKRSPINADQMKRRQQLMQRKKMAR